MPKLFFKNEKVVGLTRCIEKMDSLFKISSCAEDYKVRFDACNFVDATLSWWNNHDKTMGISIANTIS